MKTDSVTRSKFWGPISWSQSHKGVYLVGVKKRVTIA